MGRFPQQRCVNVTVVFTRLRRLQTTDSWNEGGGEEEGDDCGFSAQLILRGKVLQGTLMFFTLVETLFISEFLILQTLVEQNPSH